MPTLQWRATPCYGRGPLNPDIARHLREAPVAAGDDLTTYLRLADATHPDVKAPTIEEMMNWPAPEPGRAFDISIS